MHDRMTRRKFLKVGSGVAAGVGVAATGVAHAAPAKDAGSTVLPYGRKIVAKAAQVKENTPVAFTFPDAGSPCALVKAGRPVPGGVGPNRDLVAFSTMCPHMGCPVSYDAAARTFKCPCHFSVFDPEMGGQMVCGQATENLPQVLLEYSAKDDSVSAVAVSGLLHGRQSNVL